MSFESALNAQEGRLFPLDQAVFGSAGELAAHVGAAHPRCDFCNRRFFDEDGLWEHMHREHVSCPLCPPPTGSFAYYRGRGDLVNHMRCAWARMCVCVCVSCMRVLRRKKDAGMGVPPNSIRRTDSVGQNAPLPHGTRAMLRWADLHVRVCALRALCTLCALQGRPLHVPGA
jgi:hypothetical protein